MTFNLLIPFMACIALLEGCARPGQPSVIPGKTTEGEYIALMGKPTHLLKGSERPQARVLEYGVTSCQAQIENGVVVAHSCPPVGIEISLQYWRHQWIDKKTEFKKMDQPDGSHVEKLMQFTAGSEKSYVIYDELSDRVLRVVKYGSN